MHIQFMARLSILSNDEINALYAIPTLTGEEKYWLFELDNDDRAYLEKLDTIEQQINYILQLGYYQAVSYFFQFSFQQVKEDVEFIQKQYYPDQPFPKKRLSKHLHYLNRHQICQKFGLMDANNKFLQQLIQEAKRLAKIHVMPKYILINLLSFCQQKQTIKPAYSKLQDVVSGALKSEQKRLANKFYTDADQSIRDQLDRLLKTDNLLYNLTLLKSDQKNFSTTEILKTIDKQNLIGELYQQSQQLMRRLDISEQNIIYYADLTEFYTIQKLQTFRLKNQTRLYLLCYVHRRLHKINDHLVSSLVQKMLSYLKQGNEYQQKAVDTVEAVDRQLRNQAHKVMMVNVNNKIPDHLVRAKAFEVVPKDGYKRFLSDFKKPNFDRDFHLWEQYAKLGQTIKRNIRPIFKVIEFTCDNEKLQKAIQFLRSHINGSQSFKDYDVKDIPLDFFPKYLKRFLWDPSVKGKVVNGDRYEFMVYWQLQKGIGDIAVSIKASSSYRALEDELINIEHWATHQQTILDELNMSRLSNNIVDTLEELETSIENKYENVNQRIKSGENTSIKIKRNKQGKITHWTLPYTPLDDGANNHFFKNLPTQNIGDIIRFVDKATGFSQAFTHI